ncbi:MAG TPA: ATPase, T2SS/T4P/T4SS family [Planctomycetota bacterium]|nr:ATPase, T2SS/T4P/T4SS family [Planctomycetota bacterium]
MREPIGRIMVRHGVVTDAQIEEALRLREKGERLGEALRRLGHAGEDHVVAALAEQLRLPVVELAGREIPSEVLDQVGVKTVFRRKVLPFERENGTLRVALADPLDLDVLDELRLLVKGEVVPVLARPSEIDRLIRRYYGVAADTVDGMVEAAREELTVLREGEAREDEATALAEDAGLIKFVNQLFTEGVRDRASDIHIEPLEEGLRIRYRIDGILHQIPVPPQIGRFTSAIISRLKIMSGLNIAEKRLPQDGRIMLKALGHEIDVRVSIIPNVWGEGVCLRLLDRRNIQLTLEDLGMPPKVLEQFRLLIGQPHGILLVTGPTGSGKTTTLYAALQKINAVEDKIITIEDPVEYHLGGIKQIQVNVRTGLTFAGGLRAILRHDPDIIMVGEIRDLETAEIAIQSALTGHLVFSTLHTNDAPSALTRLIDMGLEPFLVSSTIEGLMAQRLVRRVCLMCREEVRPKVAEFETGALPEDIRTFWRGKGCPECRGTGYRGRQGVFELVVLNDSIRELVLKHASAGAVKQACIAAGMRTLRDDGWDRVRTGVTTPEEVIRITKADKF